MNQQTLAATNEITIFVNTSDGFKEKICSVNQKIFSGFDSNVFPYRPAEVIAGRWVMDVVEPLFKKHSINIDFNVRGSHIRGQRVKKKKSVL
jgi:hypothetical protein